MWSKILILNGHCETKSHPRSGKSDAVLCQRENARMQVQIKSGYSEEFSVIVGALNIKVQRSYTSLLNFNCS